MERDSQVRLKGGGACATHHLAYIGRYSMDPSQGGPPPGRSPTPRAIAYPPPPAGGTTPPGPPPADRRHGIRPGDVAM